MRNLTRRLATVERAVARMPPPRPAVDLSRLTVAELETLEVIHERYGELPRLPNGRVDLSRVSDDDLDIMAALMEKVTDRP